MVDMHITGIVASNDSEALTSATSALCHEIYRTGYYAEVVDFRNPDQVSSFRNHIKNGALRFAFGLQGVGSQLTTESGENLWTSIKVPFIGIHHDHPCHNPLNHISTSPYVANLYRFKSFWEAQQKYLPSPHQISESHQIRFTNEYQPFETPSFDQRPIKLLYLKSGNDPVTLEKNLKQDKALPKAIHDGLFDQLSRTVETPNLDLCELVKEVYEVSGFDYRTYIKDFWVHVKWMDEVIRARRAAQFVEWLKEQSGAVIIGNGWDFIDKTNAKAEFKQSGTTTESWSLYGQAQFVCNTNPYACDNVHERAMFGLLHGACVLSDRNAWWETEFKGSDALTLYDWDAPLSDQLCPVIERTQAAAQASHGAQADALTNFAYQGVGEIMELAERVRKQEA